MNRLIGMNQLERLARIARMRSRPRRTLRTRLVLTAVWSLVAISVLYFTVVMFLAPWIARAELRDAIDSACPTCEVEIGRLSFSFFPPSDIAVQDIKFKVGRPGGSEGIGRIEAINVKLSVARSTKENIVIESVNIVRPVITFVDGDAVTPKKDTKDESPGRTFAVENTFMVDGEFTYIRETKGTSATLRLHAINLTMDEFGTAFDNDSRREAVTRAVARLRIENSGEVRLEVESPLRPGPDHVDVAVEIRDQNLADLTPFFKPNAGVELSGQMVKARGRVKLRDQDMRATAWIIYHGLNIKLNSMYDRTGAEAFFMNLGADLVMKEEDLGLAKDLQTRSLAIKREKGERIVGFILRGLKEAAIKVAQAAPSPERAKPLSSPLVGDEKRPSEPPK